MRDISLVAGIFVIGFYLSSPFSILQVFNLLLHGPSSSALWLSIVVGVFVSLAVAGRFYCGWLCPFGALSEFVGRLPFKKWALPAETERPWRNLKYGLLGLIIIIVLVTGRSDYGNYEAYVTFFSFHGSVLTWSLTAVALIASIRIKRFWCRYLCPVAALTGLLTKKAEGYPGGNDCPMGNGTSAEISECIRCNRCYNRCSHCQ